MDLDVRAGEVHGLLGENGSGKSTLIKVLAGYHEPDAGTIEVRGTPLRLPLAPGEYRRLGFAFVHQDLALIPSLSVTENLFIGRIATRRGLWTSWPAERRRAREVCAAFGLEVDPAAPVGELEPIQRALLAIARAVHDIDEAGAGPDRAARLLILDEPTVFLPREQVAQLFGVMRRMAAAGSSVLFVSHDLNEVRQATDRVTVLRDGRVAGTAVTAATDVGSLVAMIVGRSLAAGHRGPGPDGPGPREMLRVRGLTTRLLSDVSFAVREGEIVGLTGLLGSGHDDVVYALFGARPASAGELSLDGGAHDLGAMTPVRAIALGMGLVPADRRRDGAIGSLSVGDNLTSVTLDRHFRHLRLRRREMREEAAALVARFDVRPPDPGLDYVALSGGNQQKALLAKWLQLSPRVLLLHEPTQGVDVGARQQIFELLRSVRAGRAVVCASSDHEQLAAVCDRVLVLGHGRVVAELTGAAVSEGRIAEECLRSTAAVEVGA